MENENKGIEEIYERESISDEYIVGMIDGEGTINITSYPDGRERPQILIFSTCKEVLDEIKETKSLTAPVMEVSRVGDNLDRKKKCYRLQVRSKSDLRKMFNMLKEHPPVIKKEEFEKVYKETKEWLYS